MDKNIINKSNRSVTFNLMDLVSALQAKGIANAYSGEIIKIINSLSPSPEEDKFSLPKKAPILWTGNHLPNDTPATFIMREYSQYIGKGLSTATIRKLDPTLASLYSAWRNPKEGPPPELPPGFDLPSKRQVIDDRDKGLTPEAAAAASRTSSRAHRKKQRANSQAQDR